MTRLIYEYQGRDHSGMPIYSCRRLGGVLTGFGPSHEMALADFEEKEQSILPSAAERDINDQIQEALADERY
jgi:hypothetical protein